METLVSQSQQKGRERCRKRHLLLTALAGRHFCSSLITQRQLRGSRLAAREAGKYEGAHGCFVVTGEPELPPTSIEPLDLVLSPKLSQGGTVRNTYLSFHVVSFDKNIWW